ncbi:bifunctional phosphoribosyl-AMP cyclohydrolase/phosphoribosyl-ATP diphosphatase HisIE [Sulfurospirillum sp. 1612]|uniref:bifunctional phosphoribosyl-AMP cyclohydrolase/phosphoribosyl-ATP diphosphatase HisIE n=1 Tax=Sulfurospirillum sp. 1612 TaxID=3094835 RepID=UPI002F927457
MNYELINSIDWDRFALIPVIAQDYQDGTVLMLAYTNKEALELTLQTKIAHYYSRSRKKLWKKGEQSGNTQEVKEIYLDCDSDTLLLKVKQNGVACHTGRMSCFFNRIDVTQELPPIEQEITNYSLSDTLYHVIQDRKKADPSKSYVASLFKKGENSVLKKVVEEAGEFCFAVKDKEEDEIVYEAADLAFHTLVALGYRNIDPERVKQELRRRFGMSGIEEKNSRKDG